MARRRNSPEEIAAGIASMVITAAEGGSRHDVSESWSPAVSTGDVPHYNAGVARAATEQRETQAAQRAARRQRRVIRKYVTEKVKEHTREQTVRRNAAGQAVDLKKPARQIGEELGHAARRIDRRTEELAKHPRIRRENRQGKVVSRKGVARIDSRSRKSGVLSDTERRRAAQTDYTPEDRREFRQTEARQAKARAKLAEQTPAQPGDRPVRATEPTANLGDNFAYKPSESQAQSQQMGLEGFVERQRAKGRMPAYPSDVEFGLMLLPPALGTLPARAGAPILESILRAGATRAGMKAVPSAEKVIDPVILGERAVGGARAGRKAEASQRAAQAAEATYRARRVAGEARSVASVKAGVRTRNPDMARVLADVGSRFPAPVRATGRWWAKKPVRRTVLAAVAAGSTKGAIDHPEQTGRDIAGLIGKIDDIDLGQALETAKEVGVLTPQVLYQTLKNIITNPDVRSTSFKSIPQFALETAQFPLVFAKEAANKGPTKAAEEMADMWIESAKLRWGPAEDKIPWDAAILSATELTQPEWDALDHWEQFDELQKAPEFGGALITLTEAAGIASGMSRAAGAAARGAARNADAVAPGLSAVLEPRVGQRRRLRVTRGEEGAVYQRPSRGAVGRLAQEVLDEARVLAQKGRERRAGRPQRGTNERRPRPEVEPGRGEVVPLSNKLRRRAANRRAGGFFSEEQLLGELSRFETVGRGYRRSPKQFLDRLPKHLRRGLSHFATRLNENEFALSALMGESGVRGRERVVTYLEERHSDLSIRYQDEIRTARQEVITLQREARERGNLNDPAVQRRIDNAKGRVEALVADPPPEIKFINDIVTDIDAGKLNPDQPIVTAAADKWREVGERQAQESPFIDASKVGEGAITAAEVSPLAKVAEHEARHGRLPDLEEVLGPTPVARERPLVARARRQRQRASMQAKRMMSNERRRGAEDRASVRTRTSREQNRVREAEVRVERVRTQARRDAEAQARRRLDRDSKNEVREAERRVERITASYQNARENFNSVRKTIADRRKRGLEPTARQQEQLHNRERLVATEQRRLNAAKKLLNRAHSHRKRLEKAYLHDARQKGERDPRIREAESTLAHSKRRLDLAKKLERRVDRETQARLTRAQKAADRSVAAAERSEAAIRNRYKQTIRGEKFRRKAGLPLDLRTWDADRQAYVRKVGKDKIVESGERGAEPGYVPDVTVTERVLEHEMTGGQRGEAPKRSKGVLFRTGRRDLTKEGLINRMLDNALTHEKARVLFRVAHLLGDDVRSVLFGEGVRVPDRRLTRKEVVEMISRAKENLARAPLPKNIALVNVGRLFEDLRREMVGSERLSPEEMHTRLTELINQDIRDPKSPPLKQLEELLNDLEQNPALWADLEGWRLMEYNVSQEIAPRLPDNPVHRKTKEVFMRSKSLASRMLLGLNPQWLGFQVYANAALMGIAQPTAFFGSGFTYWMDKATLSPEAKRSWEQTLGVSPHMADYGYMTGGKTLMGWGIHKAGLQNSKVWRGLEGRSILDPMFRLDYRNNKAFKGVFLHNKVKREAWNRMDKRMGRIMVGYDRVIGKHLPKGRGQHRLEDYQRAFEEVVKDRRSMERLGKEVDAWMGDYLRFSSAERSLLANNVMFYGFMRHSMSLALLTLPRHPIKAAILTKLGQAALEDKREILRRMMRGALKAYIRTQPGGRDIAQQELQEWTGHYTREYLDPKLDFLPITTLGDFYYKGPIDLPLIGEVAPAGWNRIGVGRAAALGNIFIEGGVFEEGKFWRLATVANPFLAMAGEAATGMDFYTGAPLRFGGESSGAYGLNSMSIEDFGRSMLTGVAELIPPLRGLSKGLSQLPPSKKSAGSFPPFFEEVPTKYQQKHLRKAARVATRRYQNRKGGALTEILRTTAPYASQPVDQMSTLFGALGAEDLSTIGGEIRGKINDPYGQRFPWSQDKEGAYDLDGAYDRSSPDYHFTRRQPETAEAIDDVIESVTGKRPRVPTQVRVPTTPQSLSRGKRIEATPKNRKLVRNKLTEAAKKANRGSRIEGPLTEGQKTFGSVLARELGISPQVVGAWMLKEQSWDYAEGYQQANYHNWLNIQPVQVGGSQAIDSHDPEFNDPVAAARYTVRWINGDDDTPGGGAAPELTDQILSLRNLSTPEEQAAALGSSVWGTGDISGTMPLVSAVASQKAKPIPKNLLRTARGVLGKQETKAIVAQAQGRAIPAKKQPGQYAGTKAVIRDLIGPYAKTQDWKDKEDRGDPTGTLHDIGFETGYAADLDADEDIVDQIASKLGLDPDEVNYGTTGLESITSPRYPGYNFEFLPYRHGSGDHVHIGAEWTGEELPPGTTLGGSVSPSSTAAVSSGGAAATGPVIPGMPAPTGRRATLPGQRMAKKNPLKLLNLIAQGDTNALVGLPSARTSEQTGIEEALALIGSAEDLRKRTLSRR